MSPGLARRRAGRAGGRRCRQGKGSAPACRVWTRDQLASRAGLADSPAIGAPAGSGFRSAWEAAWIGARGNGHCASPAALSGSGAGLVGLFSLLGPAGLSDLERERAAGFGIAALVVGAVALLGSLATRDVHALWYCSPRRWQAFRADLLDGPEGSAGCGDPQAAQANG